MLIYYWFSGLVANFALVLNLIILMGVMCYLDAALTLPGIAGIVLTIGMAIDANVLIFERIREELKAGKGVQGSGRDRLQQGVRHDHRRQPDHAHRLGDPDDHGYRPGEGIRRHADRGYLRQYVYRTRDHPPGVRYVQKLRHRPGAAPDGSAEVQLHGLSQVRFWHLVGTGGDWDRVRASAEAQMPWVWTSRAATR